jgi:serine/threonine protein kinase
MGEVYSAIDTNNKKKKAIKLIPIGDEEEYKLLRTEFEISVSLKHQNIVNTDYFGEFDDNGTHYLYCVMDFYENGNLRDYLSSQSQMIPQNVALKFMLDIAKGIEFAHVKIIHRDLKPENILLDNDQNLLICDFGLAKLIDAKTRTRTFKGSGTLPYMSPECWMLDSNTTLMDIYSMGIIFYELSVLRLPFNGTSEREFRDKHLYEQLPDITNLRVDLPIRLSEMITKMASKRPKDRYSSVTDIVQVHLDISKNIEDKKESKLDSLLQKANQKVSLTNQKELERLKQQETIDNKLKFIDYSVNSLFEIFNRKVKELNEQLERTKIISFINGSQMIIRFMDKSINISFYLSSDIQATIERRKNRILENQEEKYGFVINEVESSFIEKDNVIFIGQITADPFSNNVQVWGYNLLLRKSGPEDLYGEWWVVWFDDSAFARRYPHEYHYPLGIPEFYQEYEFGRGHVMHIRTMGINTLSNEGLDKIMEKLFE